MAAILPYDPAIGILLPNWPQTRNPPYFAVPQGLIGYWSFDLDCVQSSTKTQDLSTNFINGTLVNSPTYATGQVGAGLSFNGTNQYVTCVGTFTADLFTVALWVNLLSTPSGESFMFVQRDADSGAWGIALEMNNSNPRAQMVLAAGPTGKTLIGATTMANGIWYHLATTYDNANLRLYVNGVQDTNSPVAASGSLRGTAAQYTIGALGNAGGRYANAILDDVRIYNRGLGAWEVIQLYQAGLAGRRDAGWLLPGETEMAMLPNVANPYFYREYIARAA